MVTPQQLSLLRPLMTRAQMLKTVGADAAKQLVAGSGELKRKFGVSLNYVEPEDRIDTITYFSNFAKDVSLFGLSIGMTVAKVKRARPDATIGERQPSGFTKLQATTDSDDVVLSGIIERGAVQLLLLARADIDAVRAERRRRAEELSSQPEPEPTWASLENPDAMLLAWAESQPADRGIRETYLEFARGLIATANPDGWHIIAANWNWDNGHAPLLWIVRQRECDIATALEIFFAGQPSYYLQQGDKLSQLPKYQLEIYALLSEIGERFRRGFYRRSHIACDARKLSDRLPRQQATADYEARAEAFYPPEAAQNFGGRDLSGPRPADLAACYALADKLA